MKIAVASNGNQVTEHFGHCETFHIYHSDNHEIIKKDRLLTQVIDPVSFQII